MPGGGGGGGGERPALAHIRTARISLIMCHQMESGDVMHSKEDLGLGTVQVPFLLWELMFWNCRPESNKMAQEFCCLN